MIELFIITCDYYIDEFILKNSKLYIVWIYVRFKYVPIYSCIKLTDELKLNPKFTLGLCFIARARYKSWHYKWLLYKNIFFWYLFKLQLSSWFFQQPMNAILRPISIMCLSAIANMQLQMTIIRAIALSTSIDFLYRRIHSCRINAAVRVRCLTCAYSS